MKTRVSKKAVGVFVVSLLLLLLLVVMTSNGPAPLQPDSASECALTSVLPTPVPYIDDYLDMPMEELEDVPLTPIRHPQPSNQTPLVSGGGGVPMPWEIAAFTPHLPIYSPNPPTGPHAPYTPPQPGGSSNGACAFGHEGDSVLSGNTTNPIETRTDGDDERRYDAHKEHLYESWVSLKDDAQIVPDTVAALHTNALAQQLAREIDTELARVQAIFRATGSNHRPGDYRKLVDYLIYFEWLSADARTLNKVNIGIGNGNVLVLEREY